MTFMCLLGGLQVGGGCPPARSSCITAPASLSLTRWPEGPFRQEAGRATMINEACRAATNEFEGSAAGEVISALPPGFKPMASLETMPLRRRRRPPRIPSNGRRRRGRRALVRQRHRRDAGDGAEACGRQGSSSSRRTGEKWNTCSRGGGRKQQQTADQTRLPGDDFVVGGGCNRGVDAEYNRARSGKKCRVLAYHEQRTRT